MNRSTRSYIWFGAHASNDLTFPWKIVLYDNSSRMKEVTGNIKVWKMILTTTDNLRTSWPLQRHLTEESRWASWGSNPEGPDRKRKESGSCLVKQLVCLGKSTWPVWRLPSLPWLAWPPQDLLFKDGTAATWDFTWYLRQKLEVDLEYIFWNSKAQYPQ